MPLSPNPRSNGDTGMGPDRESPAGTPRWVKVFGLVAFVLVLVVAILHLTGHGLGPGDHMPPIDRGTQQP